MEPASAKDERMRSSKTTPRPSALPQPKPHADVVLRPYEVYQQIGALIGLALLQSLSFGILAPMMSIVITEYFARQVTQGTSIDCGVNAHSEACLFGSKEAAWWSSIFSAVGCVFLFFLSPVIGQASDVHGRKIFIVTSQVIRVGVPFSIIWFSQLGGSIGPYFFLRFVDSAFGTSSVSSAQIADVVSPTNRAAAFGILFAAFSIGYCVAAGLAPLFSRTHALYAASGLFVLRVLWSIFILPETLPVAKRAVAKASRSASRIPNPLRSMSILFRSQMFICLTSLIAITAFASNGLYHINMFYLNTVVGFDEHAMSQLLLLGGVLSILAQVLLLKPLMACVQEKGVIIIALLASIVNCGGFVATAFFPRRWIIFAVAVPSCVGELSFAAISSLKSVNVSEKEQGRLQGAIYGARAIFEATGPIVYAGIYARMKEDSPVTRTIPFLLSIALYAVCIGIAVVMRVPVHAIAKPLPLVSPTFAASPSSMTMVFSTDDDDDSETDSLAMFDEAVDGVLTEPLLGRTSTALHPDVDV